MGAGERPKVILYKRLDRPLLDVEDLSPVQVIVASKEQVCGSTDNRWEWSVIEMRPI